MGQVLKYLIFVIIALPVLVIAFIYTLIEIIIDQYKIKYKRWKKLTTMGTL